MGEDLLSIVTPLVGTAQKMGANEVEIYAQRTSSKDVNIESNALKSATSQILEGAGIRVLKDKAVGFSSVNSLNQKSLENGLRGAVAIAKVTPAMDNYYFSDPKRISQVADLFDSAVADMSMDDVIEKAESLLMTTKDVDSRVRVDSGSFSASTTETAIATSSGLQEIEKKTALSWFILGMAVDGEDIGSFDYDVNASIKLKDANPETTGRDLGMKVLTYLNAKKTESFEGQAIISSDALGDLIDVIIQSASANKIQAGASYLIDRLGEPVFSENLTIVDDGTVSNKIGSSSFDREGIPHSRHRIVDKGIFRGVLYDTFAANKDDLESTGHASGQFRQTPTISSTNFEILPGSKKLEDMISEIDHGLYIPRISAFPDPVSGDFAGPVKGGQLIRNGEVECTLKEITITGNLFEALRNIRAISKESKSASFQGQSWSIPNITVTGMKFAC